MTDNPITEVSSELILNLQIPFGFNLLQICFISDRSRVAKLVFS